jgi:predicted RNA-binding Zn ribbon-like protein
MAARFEATSTGQWFEPAGDARWWFDSGSIALDFAYTGELDGNAEVLSSPTDLGSWLAERFPRVDPNVSDREFSDALGLRAAIAGLALAAVDDRPSDPNDVDVINLFGALADLPPALDGGTRQAGASRARATHALSTIARDAIRTFGAELRPRIRGCSADDCSLIYLDTSRSGNRRWCSMQRCGNRAKVRAHRSRGSSNPTTR